MTFSPKILRDNLVEWKIQSMRNATLSASREDLALDGCGSEMLRSGTICFLIGFVEVGVEYLEKGREFLRTAIAENELPRGYYHGGTEAHRLRDLALCNWFLDRHDDLESLGEAVDGYEVYFLERAAKKLKLSKPGMQFALPTYLDSQEYERLFKRFDETGLKKPAKLKNIHGEGTMSYVIARQRLGLEYTADQMTAALEAFLKRNVPVWLNTGLYDTTARWMKRAFWKPGDDPVATLLKCYDYMPEHIAPDYP